MRVCVFPVKHLTSEQKTRISFAIVAYHMTSSTVLIIRMKLMLLLWVFKYSETIPIHVMGKKGASVTFPCELEDRGIFHISLNRLSKNILVYQNEYCRKQVCKKGACDVVMKDLRLRDAGKYSLNVYYMNAMSVLEPQIRTYKLHIHDDFFVKTGKKLKLDVLLPDARQVLHQNKTTAEWKEVWKRDRKKRVRVTHDRMNDRDGTLTITEFMADDAGTYRVMDFEGEILITVTVADEKKSKSTEKKLNCTDDGKKHNHRDLSEPAGQFVSAVFAALPVLILIAAVVKKLQ
ncbi:uncharacterized protein LOC127157324 isoform X2 [Labeo rohita]|uniref:uncharacterized protein LOC127157324 isoform X2 n=1 Tax=Labeo rohita TaxID=84645 RepID=UPI0021E1EC5B|nr:uncharacterized protein LOC127157324 isoform X2 [Labeo rohita]